MIINARRDWELPHSCILSLWIVASLWPFIFLWQMLCVCVVFSVLDVLFSLCSIEFLSRQCGPSGRCVLTSIHLISVSVGCADRRILIDYINCSSLLYLMLVERIATMIQHSHSRQTIVQHLNSKVLSCRSHVHVSIDYAGRRRKKRAQPKWYKTTRDKTSTIQKRTKFFSLLIQTREFK